jgi:glucose/arabinose dehydrogenase
MPPRWHCGGEIAILSRTNRDPAVARALAFRPALDASLSERLLPQFSERVRALVMGPDEKLYQTSDDGTIVRYAPRAP